MSMLRTRKGRLAVRLFAVVTSVIVAILVLEVLLRILGYSYPILTTTDPTLGLALRPGAEGWYRKEGEAYIRISRDGFRDKEHSKRKPPNVVRIAVLGDSFAEALQVPVENTFWAVMEDRLKGCNAFSGKQIEVLNFGVSGYGTAQELLSLRHKVWDYQPDIVLLAVTTGNDISDNSRALKHEDVPYFVMRDGQLVLDDSFKDSSFFRHHNALPYRLFRGAADYSRVLQGLYEARYALRFQRGAAAEPKLENGEPGQNPEVYREPHEPVWADAWLITDKLILLMRDEVLSRSARFMVVTLSNAPQVNPDPMVRKAFKDNFKIEDEFYPEHRIARLGEQGQFAVLNLAPMLQSYAEQNHVYLHGFGRLLGQGHWNVTGHRVAGEMIARQICSDG